MSRGRPDHSIENGETDAERVRDAYASRLSVHHDGDRVWRPESWSRRILRIAAILASVAFSATVWIEAANGHWTHVGALFLGGLTFLMVLGALLAILDGEGV